MGSPRLPSPPSALTDFADFYSSHISGTVLTILLPATFTFSPLQFYISGPRSWDNDYDYTTAPLWRFRHVPGFCLTCRLHSRFWASSPHTTTLFHTLHGPLTHVTATCTTAPAPLVVLHLCLVLPPLHAGWSPHHLEHSHSGFLTGPRRSFTVLPRLGAR